MAWDFSFAAWIKKMARKYTDSVALGQGAIQGPQGIRGERGETGPPGAQGIQGIQGIQGVQGLQGIQGEQGERGLQGEQGTPGVAGQDGAPGAPGQNGIQGERGEQGAPGVAGERGPQGEQGESAIVNLNARGPWDASTTYMINDLVMCADGNSYVSIADNNTGLNPPGYPGSWAIFVAAGAQGEKGDTGERGLQGIQGERGETGQQGEPGDAGAAGEKGEPGTQGIQGERGETGERGLQGEQGVQGEQGIQGPQGDTGATGAQGEQGVQGIQGEQGVAGPPININPRGIWSVAVTDYKLNDVVQYEDTDGNHSYIYTDETPGSNAAPSDDPTPWVIFVMQGPRGIQGVQGERGIQGIQGETGEQGEQGIQGIQGEQGIQGTQGERGLPGESGEMGTSTWNITANVTGAQIRSATDTTQNNHLWRVGDSLQIDQSARSISGTSRAAFTRFRIDALNREATTDATTITLTSMGSFRGLQGAQGIQGPPGHSDMLPAITMSLDPQDPTKVLLRFHGGFPGQFDFILLQHLSRGRKQRHTRKSSLAGGRHNPNIPRFTKQDYWYRPAVHGKKGFKTPAPALFAGTGEHPSFWVAHGFSSAGAWWNPSETYGREGTGIPKNWRQNMKYWWSTNEIEMLYSENTGSQLSYFIRLDLRDLFANEPPKRLRREVIKLVVVRNWGAGAFNEEQGICTNSIIIPKPNVNGEIIPYIV